MNINTTIDQELKKNLFNKRQVLLDAKWREITEKFGKSREEKRIENVKK